MFACLVIFEFLWFLSPFLFPKINKSFSFALKCTGLEIYESKENGNLFIMNKFGLSYKWSGR